MAQPQQAPGPGPSQGQGEGGGSGDQLTDMVNGLGQGLTTLVEGLQKAGAPKEIVEPFGASLEAFTEGANRLMGGAGDQGAAPMEAGAANAVPSGQNQMRG